MIDIDQRAADAVRLQLPATLLVRRPPDFPDLDLDLLELVLDKIDANPEIHDQQVYAGRGECGTAYCVAGWVTEMTKPVGWEFDWDARFMISIGALRYEAESFHITDGKGDDRSIAGYAQEQLGLSEREAVLLFASENTRPQLRRMFEVLRAGYTLTPTVAVAIRNTV